MKPTVGRIVHFMEGGQPLPALITKVHNDTCVNLRVFYDSNRNGAWKSSVTQGTGEASWAWPPIVSAPDAHLGATEEKAPAAVAQADGSGVCVK
jgi:hypothetical protein